MKQLSDFYPYMRIHLPGVSEPAMDQALLTAAEEFCVASEAVRVAADPILTIAGTAEYDLDVDLQTDVFLLKYLRRDTIPMGITAQALLRGFRSDDTLGTPTVGSVMVDGQTPVLVVYPTPDAVYELTATVAVKPKPTATYLPDALFYQWRSFVVAWAVGLLMDTPGQAYTNVDKAATRLAYGRYGAANAKAMANLGGAMSSLSVQMAPFA